MAAFGMTSGKVGMPPSMAALAPKPQPAPSPTQNPALAPVQLDPWGSVVGSYDSERNYGRVPTQASAQPASSSSASYGSAEPSEYERLVANAQRINAESDKASSDSAAAAKQKADRDDSFNRMQALIAQVTSMPTATGSSTPTPLPGQPSASDLAFARAKDKVGLIGGSQREAARSSGDPRAMARVINNAGTNLSDFATNQALQEARRAGEVEDRNVAASLTQRQQNLSLLPSMLSLLSRAY